MSLCVKLVVLEEFFELVFVCLVYFYWYIVIESFFMLYFCVFFVSEGEGGGRALGGGV